MEQERILKALWSGLISQHLPEGTKENHEILPARCAKENICNLARLGGNKDNYNRQTYNLNFNSRQFR